MAESKLRFEPQTETHQNPKRARLHGQYRDKREIERTYDGWPYEIPPHKLIEAHFYSTGVGDQVKCDACDLILKDWKEVDDPMQIHVKNKPGCSFVVHRPKAYVSREHRTTHHDVISIAPDSIGENEGSENQNGESVSGNCLNVTLSPESWNHLTQENESLKEENERQKETIVRKNETIVRKNEEIGRLKSQLEEKKSNDRSAARESANEFFTEEEVNGAVEVYKRRNGNEDFTGAGLCKIIFEKEEAGGSLSAEDGEVEDGQWNEPLAAEGPGEAS